MKEFKVTCFFYNDVNSFDMLDSMRVLRFKASSLFDASIRARDYLQSCAQDLELLGCLDKIEVVEVK